MRPVVAIALTAATAGGVGLTLGVAPASAADSSPSSCVAAGYRAQAKVSFRRTPTESYIDSISVNVDKRAGAHNKVRIVVKDGDTTVFYYASANTVTAGPFLFDYTDNPIPLHQTNPSDQYRADVTFDFDRGAGGATSPEGSSATDPDGVESGRDESGDNADGAGGGAPTSHKHGKHSDANPASVQAPTRCTATVRF
jgi:hypothetical protein